MNIAMALEMAAEAFPDRIAVTSGGATMTYAELLSAARSAGAAIRDSGCRYVGLLEAHLSARSDDAALRDRLGALTDQVLRQRHGIRLDDPRASELLGPDVADVLAGSPRRLGLAEIDRCLTRIEDL